MAASAEEIAERLEAWCETLREQTLSDPVAVTAPGDQRAVENLIAAAVAYLTAAETPPTNDSDPSRPILAKDLLLSADLVQRAVRDRLLRF